jgi:hypothetical protein
MKKILVTQALAFASVAISQMIEKGWEKTITLPIQARYNPI